MKNFESVDEILDFAIAREESAYAFYTKWAGKSKNQGISKFFAELAAEENVHKEKLLEIKAGKELESSTAQVKNLMISEFTVVSKIDEDSNYQDALLAAMKREKAAFKFYTALSELADDEKLVAFFKMLAQEEAKHKLKLELEYDENILSEN